MGGRISRGGSSNCPVGCHSLSQVNPRYENTESLDGLGPSQSQSSLGYLQPGLCLPTDNNTEDKDKEENNSHEENEKNSEPVTAPSIPDTLLAG